MAYTETTTTTYGQRVKKSFGGIGSGILLFIVGTILLWWNEGRAVKTTKMLNEAAGVTVEMTDIGTIDPQFRRQACPCHGHDRHHRLAHRFRFRSRGDRG